MQGAGDRGGTIPIAALGIDQLTNLQKQVEQEIQFFVESAGQLKLIQEKNVASAKALEGLADAKDGEATALIPLSESMYVRARLADPSKALVEIGTGYYAEMHRDKAVEFFGRKQKYLTDQLETIDKIVADKRRTRQVIVEALQQKVGAAIASQPRPK